MTRTSRVSAFVVGATLLAVLSACAPGSPTPTPTSTGSPSSDAPAPDVTPGAAEHPVQVFGDGCAALVPTSLVTAISPDANTPHESLATEYAAHPVIPRHASITQVGGMLCEWSNGEPYSGALGTSGFRGIQLAVLPDAAEGWIQYATYYDLDPVAGQVYCTGVDFCGIDIFESGYWFNVEAQVSEGPGTLESLQALADHLRREALAFGAAGAPWMPEGHRVVPSDCSIIVPDLIVDEIFGADHTTYEGDGGGGWSIWYTAILRNSDTGCGWYSESGSQSLEASWLNGGAWLAAELGATTGTPLPLAGLTDDDSATIACDASGCDVTLLVAGNWLTASAHGSPDDSAGATRLAAHLVEVMRD